MAVVLLDMKTIALFMLLFFEMAFSQVRDRTEETFDRGSSKVGVIDPNVFDSAKNAGGAGSNLYRRSEKSGAEKALSVLSIVSGTLMVPLGGLVVAANSIEKCEENDGMGLLSGGIGPCSESGPSTGGQVLGFGMIGVGLYFIVNGLMGL